MHDSTSELKTLVSQIASELVFAEPGKDDGLLPINSLLLQIEDHVDAPEVFARGVQAARACVDEILSTSGKFSASSIAQLSQWTGWSQEALLALESGGDASEFALSSKIDDVKAPVESKKADEKQDDGTLILNLGQDADLLREFLQESAEHLQNIEQGVLVMEEAPNDLDTLNSIFRAFHTFKGGAGFLNLGPIQVLAHELESLLDMARQKKLEITNDVINVILEGGDCLKRFCEAIGERVTSGDGGKPIEIDTVPLRKRIKAVLAGEAPRSAATSVSKEQTPAETHARVSQTAAAAVKVDTHKLDGLIDAVGEMVIAQSLVVQNPLLRSVQDEHLTRNLAELARITKDLQRIAMSLRMVPIRATFQKMHRLVRDISSKVGKKIDLIISGEDTELDRTIVEEISDPLIHMVRNSVDHGIELPEMRATRGKPAHGTVQLKAYHQGGNIVIEIADDGNGLDRAAILAKAHEKGLVKPDDHLTDSEIFGLIFAAGFSTATKVTELSGRGVGMDVVRRNIEKLRGKVEIQSVPGQGATFRIFLPLTLAIIDGLLVGVGEHRYILPTLTVSESFRPGPGSVKTVQSRGEVVEVRGQLRPLVRLYEHLGIQPTSNDPAQSIVLVVESSSRARCVMVDRLLGKQEVVIKSLGDAFHQNRCVSGAAILGDGRVGLILDSQALVNLEPVGSHLNSTNLN